MTKYYIALTWNSKEIILLLPRNPGEMQELNCANDSYTEGSGDNKLSQIKHERKSKHTLKTEEKVCLFLKVIPLKKKKK